MTLPEAELPLGDVLRSWAGGKEVPLELGGDSQMGGWGAGVTSVGVLCNSDTGLGAQPAEVLLDKLEPTPGTGKGRPGVWEMLGPGGTGRLCEWETGGLTWG